MLNIQIVTPDGTVYESDEVVSLTLPNKLSVITILEDHAPLVSLLEPGEVEITKKDGHSTFMAISTGTIEVKPNNIVYILADTAERAETIDIERAEEARKRAEEYLKLQENLADIDFAKLQAKIQKELARINVGRKYKKLPQASNS